MIYSLILSGHYISLGYRVFSSEPPGKMLCCADINADHDLHDLISLPSTCQQIRAETRDLVFSTNEFGGKIYIDAAEFIRGLSLHKRSLIRKLRMRYCHIQCLVCGEDVFPLEGMVGLEEVVVLVSCEGDWERGEQCVAKVKDVIERKVRKAVRVELVDMELP